MLNHPSLKFLESVNAVRSHANINVTEQGKREQWWPRLKYRTLYNTVTINSSKLVDSSLQGYIGIDSFFLFLFLDTVVYMEVLDAPIYKTFITL